jgi:hypothetical protein
MDTPRIESPLGVGMVVVAGRLRSEPESDCSSSRWMAVDAGLAGRSVLLTAFGADRLIELLSGGTFFLAASNGSVSGRPHASGGGGAACHLAISGSLSSFVSTCS